MISAETGSILRTTGRRSAIAPVGPMPGSTPTNVPRKAPTSAKRRLCGSSAMAKPCASKPMTSPTARPPGLDMARRQSHIEEIGEKEDGDGGRDRRDDDRTEPAGAAEEFEGDS